MLILADDLGYGDLGCYGSGIATPNLDQMAQEGVRFTDYYAGNPVCSPSRAALLTGRYPVRCGVPDVLFPRSTGLPASETTMAQMLKRAGYKTICVGKWHLGDLPGYLPRNRGFDEFYGIPYSNDMAPRLLLDDTEVVEEQAQLEKLTPRYTDRACSFIRKCAKDSPFFLYLAHTYPHIPLAASPAFRGKSGLGTYGDVMMELDWSVGKVIGELEAQGLTENTLVMFTSDNGPWFQGSPGRLRGRKGTTYEGGVRVPFLAKMPGRIPAGTVCSGVASMLDMLPTAASLCGAALPGNPLDGIDIWPLLSGQEQRLEREALLYFDGYNLQCARLGKWKMHVSRYNCPPYVPPPPEGRFNSALPWPELFDMERDPDESYDLADAYPEIVIEIGRRIEALLVDLPGEVRQARADAVNRRSN